MTEQIVILIFFLLTLVICACLLAQNKQLSRRTCALLKEKNEAESSVQEKVEQVRKEAFLARDSMVADRIEEINDRLDTDNVHLLSQALIGQTTRQLIANIKKLVETRVTRTSQEFIGNVSDEADGVIRDLNIELCERIWDACQGYKEKTKISPYVFPDGIKIAYTKGIRTIVVVEQKPQVRTVTFDKDLVTGKVASKAQGQTGSGYRFTLAFPFVYFVIVFDNGKYESHELYFRNNALTSANEYVHLAPIPNVFRNDGDDDKPMCMGVDFSTSEESTIARQCNAVVAGFWQITFSDDLGTGDPEKVDKRIRNYAVWQKETEKNPLFVLDIVWPKGKTIKGVVETLLEIRPHKHAMDSVDKKIREQLEAGVAKLMQRIKTEIAGAKAKEINTIKLDQQSEQLLEDVILGHTKNVFEKCTI